MCLSLCFGFRIRLIFTTVPFLFFLFLLFLTLFRLLGSKGSKWGQSAAKVLLGQALKGAAEPPVQRLRKALAANATSVVAVFKSWDHDGDGKVSRREFVKSLPKLDLIFKEARAMDII